MGLRTCLRAAVLAASALAGMQLPVEQESGPTYFSTVTSPDDPKARFASDPYLEGKEYGALRRLVANRDWVGVIRTLKEAGLSGMGGAGFPASIKLETVRSTFASQKYVVCNADESEPGTV